VEEVDAADRALLPTAFTAMILKKYAVPFAKPVTVTEVVALTVSLNCV
jgi:hypothetical protein